MGIVEILLLGVALSMDAFAVTISNAVAFPRESRGRMMLMPVMFGAFQAIMPIIGYYLSSLAASLIEQFAGIVTFVILGFIGGNMIREGVKAMRASKAGDGGEGPENTGPEQRTLTLAAIISQAVATSIDALAVGVSLLASGTSISLAATVIGVTTFALCLVALAIGRRFGDLLGDRAEVAGGVVLVLIGLKALFF